MGSAHFATIDKNQSFEIRGNQEQTFGYAFAFDSWCIGTKSRVLNLSNFKLIPIKEGYHYKGDDIRIRIINCF
jgi:hypothetical protein